MSLRALKQYIELYHLNGIADFFMESKEFRLELRAEGQQVKTESREQKTAAVDSIRDLNILAKEYAKCQKCVLHKSRVKLVYGEGRQDADILIVGNPPNSDENVYGRPFVGEIGKLFDNMLNKLQLGRKDLYITNITKCKAHLDVKIDSPEMKKCMPYLSQQIDIIKPKLVLIMGELAANIFFDKNESIDYYRKTQGQTFNNMLVFVTYGLAEMLNNKDLRWAAWEDLQQFSTQITQR